MYGPDGREGGSVAIAICPLASIEYHDFQTAEAGRQTDMHSANTLQASLAEASLTVVIRGWCARGAM